MIIIYEKKETIKEIKKMKCLPFDLGGIVSQYMDIEYDRENL